MSSKKNETTNSTADVTNATPVEFVELTMWQDKFVRAMPTSITFAKSKTETDVLDLSVVDGNVAALFVAHYIAANASVLCQRSLAIGGKIGNETVRKDGSVVVTTSAMKVANFNKVLEKIIAIELPGKAAVTVSDPRLDALRDMIIRRNANKGVKMTNKELLAAYPDSEKAAAELGEKLTGIVDNQLAVLDEIDFSVE